MPKQKNLTLKPIIPEENSKIISVTAKDEAEAKKRLAEFTYRRSLTRHG